MGDVKPKTLAPPSSLTAGVTATRGVNKHSEHVHPLCTFYTLWFQGAQVEETFASMPQTDDSNIARLRTLFG